MSKPRIVLAGILCAFAVAWTASFTDYAIAVVSVNPGPTAAGDPVVALGAPVGPGLWQGATEVFDDRPPGLEIGFEIGAETRPVEEVAHANPTAGDLVFVARSNAALRRADGAIGFRFSKLVDQLVVRKNHVGALADQQAGQSRHAAFSEGADLLEQHRRVDDGALADDTLGLLVENPRGNQMKDQFLATDD